jgi:hypothetical protein
MISNETKTVRYDDHKRPPDCPLLNISRFCNATTWGRAASQECIKYGPRGQKRRPLDWVHVLQDYRGNRDLKLMRPYVDDWHDDILPLKSFNIV